MSLTFCIKTAFYLEFKNNKTQRKYKLYFSKYLILECALLNQRIGTHKYNFKITDILKHQIYFNDDDNELIIYLHFRCLHDNRSDSHIERSSVYLHYDLEEKGEHKTPPQFRLDCTPSDEIYYDEKIPLVVFFRLYKPDGYYHTENYFLINALHLSSIHFKQPMNIVLKSFLYCLENREEIKIDLYRRSLFFLLCLLYR